MKTRQLPGVRTLRSCLGVRAEDAREAWVDDAEDLLRWLDVAERVVWEGRRPLAIDPPPGVDLLRRVVLMADRPVDPDPDVRVAQVAGGCDLSLDQGRVSVRWDGREARLHGLWVDPGARGRGLGRRLARAAVAAWQLEAMGIAYAVADAGSPAEAALRAADFRVVTHQVVLSRVSG